MLMIQAGAPVDAVIDQLIPLLEQGDIVMDGGNSFFEDTRRRSKTLAEAGIHYLGVGISGGEEGARFGPSIMPGGEEAPTRPSVPFWMPSRPRPWATPAVPTLVRSARALRQNGPQRHQYADMQLIAEAYLLLKYVETFPI